MAHYLSGEKVENLIYTAKKMQIDLAIMGSDLATNMEIANRSEPTPEELTALKGKIASLVSCAEELTRRNVPVHINAASPQHKIVGKMISDAVAKSQVLSARRLPLPKKQIMKLPMRRRLK